MNSTCYLCGSSQNKPVFIENGIPIVRCSNCAHVFSTYQQEEHYEGYWQEEQYDLDWWDLAHRDIYDQFISTFMLKESGNILDIGCGLGFFVKRVMEKKPKWNVQGYEMSPNAVHFAREKNNLQNVYQGIVQNSGLALESQDIVTLWDVIEHIPKPKPLLDYIYSILKPGGVLFLQTPNFPIQLIKAKLKVMVKGMKPDVHYLEAKDHINNYSMRTFAILGANSGFKDARFFILKPILSVAGSKSNLGKVAKISYYYCTKLLWLASFQSINWNNTLFATMKKE